MFDQELKEGLKIAVVTGLLILALVSMVALTGTGTGG